VPLHYLATIIDRRGNDDLRAIRECLPGPPSDSNGYFGVYNANVASCWIVATKNSHVQDLALAFQDGRVQTRRLSKQSNEEIMATLTRIRGIGRWTVEMFLIFPLNRPDVLPVDDLGIRHSVQRWYRLSAPPNAVILKKLAEPWHSYASMASWYLWKARRLLEP
jgi:DNA-3-methyladenine glycosylase II